MNSIQKHVILIITENCNLACSYCYEHHKSFKIMTCKTAKKIIDKEFIDDDYDDILFEFFGGEPFLEFNLIKQLHNYIIEKKADFNKNALCFVTTNGTVLNDEMKDWLIKNKNTLVCSVSLDGTSKMHNINRNNSFDNIDAEFFSTTWENQSCKMTITEDTLSDLSDGVIYLHKLGFSVVASFAQGIEWKKTDNEIVLERELSKLVEFYINNPSVPLCSLLDKKLNLLSINGNQPKWCGMGKELRAYDVNGNRYPCQAFAPQTLGEESNNFVNLTECNFTEFNDDFCNDCEIKSICPTCYGANYQLNGKMNIRDKNLCKLNKMCILASSYIQFDRITKKSPEKITSEEYLTLKSVHQIQKCVSI